MDEDSLNQFLSINQILRKKVYSIQMPEAIILVWTQHFLMPMANRKVERLTPTIKVTVTIHLFAMMDSQEI